MWDDLEKGMFYHGTSVVLAWYLCGESVVSNFATLNLSTNLRDSLFFHLRFGIFKFAKSGIFFS